MLAVVVLIILLIVFSIKAIAGIKPREYSQAQIFTEQEKNVEMQADETITLEEFMARTPRKLDTELIEKNGKFCLVETETKLIKWCE